MRRDNTTRPTSAPYITMEGFAMLREEEKRIWKDRAGVARALAAAAAEGDRSENAEYIYRKRQLAQIDRRIRYLQRRLPGLTVVDGVADETRVYFSAWVTLETAGGVHEEFRIVGGDEIVTDSTKGYISVDSPLARAMLGKLRGDEVVLRLNGHERMYRITGIRYR